MSLAGLLCCLLSAPLATEPGYLPNGSMTAGDKLPTGWEAPRLEEGPGRLEAARDTVVFHTGPASLRLSTVGGSAKGNVATTLPGLAGREVAVTGWLRAEGNLGYCALAFIVPEADPGYVPILEVRPSPSWQRVNARVKVPAGGQAPRLILLLQGEGSLWADDLAVLPGDRFQPSPIVSEFVAPPLYAYLSWEKQPRAVEGGLAIRAKDGRGGCGFLLAADLSTFAGRTPALTVTAGPQHASKALRVTLRDADGTGHEYSFDLSGLAPGETRTIPAADGASLTEPGKLEAAGKEPGFNAGQVTGLQLNGDWGNGATDLLLRRLELLEPTPEQLAARERLRAKLAAEAEQARQAEEARRARVAALLAGAPHPPDGPDLVHVGAVAPDTLALRLQEKEYRPAPQVPYEPQEGDTLKRSGETIWVVENGELRQAEKDILVERRQGNRTIKLGHLAPNAKMIKPEDTAVGVELTTETVAEPAAYRLTALDEPDWGRDVQPAAVGWKKKPNGPRSLTHEITIYLKLPRPLTAGRRYRLDFPGLNLRQASVEYHHEPARARSEAIHVSAIGFRPDDPFKRAFLSCWQGTGGPLDYPDDTPFQLLDEATGQVVHEGRAQRLFGPDDKESFKAGRNYTKAEVLALDFSDFKQPGQYRVHVPGIGCSDPVRLAPEVWEEAFRLSLHGLLAHRSGIALGPPVTDYVRPRPMHPADDVRIWASAGSEVEAGSQDGAFRMLADKRTETLLPDAWGGHMDAGDWDRNTRHPAAFWLLLDLYELYPERIGAIKLALPAEEAHNHLPDILDEALWNLDFHRRLQTADGGVSGGVESTSHPRPGEASWQESEMLSAYAPDPRASYVYAGSAAKLARLVRPLDPALAGRYAESARRAQTWAVAREAEFLGRLTDAARPKMATEFRNARNLAALELWLLTGDAADHDDFVATTCLREANPDGMPQLKAVLSYARLPEGRGDAALRTRARQWLVKMADTALAFGAGNSFGVTTSIPQLPPMGFVGYFSTPEMIGAVLPEAWRLTGDEKYLAGAIRACQFAAGANPMNLALTTGLGPRPVRYPLHIDSQITGQPAPAGITVYGISDPAENYDFDSWAYTWFLNKMVPSARSWPAAEMYWDIWVVPSTNEYTIHQTIIPTACYWGFLAARP